MGYVTARILREYIAKMTYQINLTWQNMSVRTEQAGRIARIVKCDYIYMTVLSPSIANYKIWK
jgi:hypothetical protein